MTFMMVILGISTFLVFYFCFTLIIQPYSNNLRMRLQRVRLLDLSQNEQKMETDYLTMRLLHPITARLKSVLRLEDLNREDIQAKLERAGLSWTPADYFARKLGIAVIIVFFGLFFTINGSKGLGHFIINWIPMALVGYVLPVMVVRTKIKSYEERLLEEFPDFVDATRGYLCTGMSIFLTIKHVKDVAGTGLAPLLEKLCAELEIYDQTTALRKFSQRAGIIEAQNFVVAIEQGISAGIPLREILTNQSHLMREIRKLNLKLKIKKKPVYLALVGGLLFINIFIIVGLPAMVTILSIRGLNN